MVVFKQVPTPAFSLRGSSTAYLSDIPQNEDLGK